MSNIATLRDDYTIIVQNLGIIPRSVVVKLLTLEPKNIIFIPLYIYTTINIYITPQGKKLHVAQFTLQFILMILLS